MAKRRKLSHTWNAIVVNDVRGWVQQERDVHFNTIVRDLFSDCLTKFDCDLITVEWPIVSSGKNVQFWIKIKFFVDSTNSLSLPTPANDVIDIEKKSMQKPQEIKNSLLTFPLHTFFMKS